MPLIHVQGLTKLYAMGDQPVHALRGVTLAIDEGDLVAIMGASGSDKSTLMNILGRLDQPSSGSYLLAGEAVESLDADQLAALRNRTADHARGRHRGLGAAAHRVPRRARARRRAAGGAPRRA